MTAHLFLLFPQALLARPKTDKTRTAEERIASLERELRDVHGFILGTNAPGKDAPGKLAGLLGFKFSLLSDPVLGLS